MNSSGGATAEFRVHCDRECVICGAAVPGMLLGEVREHEYRNTTDQTFPVFQCPQCNLVYLYPRPDVSELSAIYPSDYYSYHLSLNAPEGEGGKRSAVQGLFYRVMENYFRDRIVRHVTPAPAGRPLRILDVGCGVGAQLDKMREIFPGAETHGVEMNRLAADKAAGRGHRTYCGRFEDVEIPRNYFDIVISVHVIEHVARPDLFLEKCAALACDTGIVYIETPNTDCVDFRMLKGGHWGGYHAPRHWYLFDSTSFARLADRLRLRILTWKPYTNSAFWNWTCHSLCREWFGAKLADAIFPPVRIFYGGLQSLLILGFFGVLERLLLAVTGKGCSLWIIFEKAGSAQAAESQ